MKWGTEAILHMEKADIKSVDLVTDIQRKFKHLHYRKQNMLIIKQT